MEKQVSIPLLGTRFTQSIVYSKQTRNITTYKYEHVIAMTLNRILCPKEVNTIRSIGIDPTGVLKDIEYSNHNTS